MMRVVCAQGLRKRQRGPHAPAAHHQPCRVPRGSDRMDGLRQALPPQVRGAQSRAAHMHACVRSRSRACTHAYASLTFTSMRPPVGAGQDLRRSYFGAVVLGGKGHSAGRRMAMHGRAGFPCPSHSPHHPACLPACMRQAAARGWPVKRHKPLPLRLHAVCCVRDLTCMSGVGPSLDPCTPAYLHTLTR